MLMIYLHTKFQMLRPSDSLVISTTRKSKLDIMHTSLCCFTFYNNFIIENPILSGASAVSTSQVRASRGVIDCRKLNRYDFDVESNAIGLTFVSNLL
jgi:hypothetical protein